MTHFVYIEYDRLIIRKKVILHTRSMKMNVEKCGKNINNQVTTSFFLFSSHKHRDKWHIIL